MITEIRPRCCVWLYAKAGKLFIVKFHYKLELFKVQFGGINVICLLFVPFNSISATKHE